MRDLPSIDIAGGSANTARKVDAACRDTGFMYLRGHGIAHDTIDRVRAAVIEYFNRPLEEKLRDPVRARCSLYGPNNWPEDAGELRQAVREYWQARDRVTDQLLGILGAAPENPHFDLGTLQD